MEWTLLYENRDEARMPHEKTRLLQALREAADKKTKAASLLGMSRTTLYRKRREHGLLKNQRPAPSSSETEPETPADRCP